MRHLLRRAKIFIWVGIGLPLFFSALLLTNATSALAQDVACTFIPPSVPLTAGSRGSLWLYCMNNSPYGVVRTFDLSMPCTLTADSGSSDTVLLLNTNSSAARAAIAPGSFVKVEYLVDIPLTSNGPVTLFATNYNQIVIFVEQSSPGVAVTPQPSPASPVTNRTASAELREYISNHVYFYEPIYFMLGTAPAAEFQLSFKYRLFNLDGNWNPFTHLYLGYTQTSFWDAFAKSPSFYDTSYKPSAFLYYPNVVHNEFFQLDLQFGGEHESNGRGGALERSFDTAYMQPTATFALPCNFQFTLQPRAWAYFLVGDNNPDMDYYRGYADLRTALTWTDPHSTEKIQFATRLRVGDEGTRAGLQLDLRFNLADAPVLRKFSPAIQVQYFAGYGQSLIQYNEPSHSLRAGLCLWY
jgi:outer membrane phospholipase A